MDPWKKYKVSRRQFLSRIGSAGVLAPALLGSRPVSAQGALSAPRNLHFGTGATSVLGQNDLTHLGSFDIPDTLGGFDTFYGVGLTHRYVGGALRFFVTTFGASDFFGVTEIDYPGVSLTSPPTASAVTRHGDVYRGRAVPDDPAAGYQVRGLYWDETDQRLYWFFGSEYSNTATNVSMGFSTLNPNVAYGPFYIDRGWKNSQTGMVAIPPAFANAYCGGKRLGIGCGGYWSLVGVGGASSGPSLAAMSPPSTSLPARSTIPTVTLVDYPWAATPYGPPYRAHRIAGYTDGFDNPGWQPQGGVGHYQWSDYIYQAAAWVKTGTKEGLLFAHIVGLGLLHYVTSDLEASAGTHQISVYNRADLAAVAQRLVGANTIQPTYWEHKFSSLTYPLAGWRGGLIAPQVVGVTFDSTTNRLYIRHRWGSVHAYQVG